MIPLFSPAKHFISSVSWNEIDLPQTVTFSNGSTINYYYAADGSKLREVRTISGTTTTIDWCDDLVLETDDYYPLGGPLPTGSNTASQPEKYQGKDWNPAASFNVYDFGARLYDPALGRWISQDPMAEKYYPQSPYLFCAGNPMKFVDPDGSYFTPRSYPYVQALLDYSYQQLDILSEREHSLNQQMNLNNSPIERIGMLLSREILLASIAEYRNTINEITTMAASNQGYNIVISNVFSNEIDSDTIRGGSYFNFETDLFDMVIPHGGIPGLLSHEMKHGAQFEIGEFSSGNTKGASYLYDIDDEYEAYHRQAFYDGGYFSHTEIHGMYPHLPNRNPFLLHSLEVQGAEIKAKQFKMAFRINGKTYR